MTDSDLYISTFAVDATPDIGTPIEYGSVTSVKDPLSCRGVVILGAGEPIVLAAIDWFGNFNGGYDTWRVALADAANTSPERVAIHSVHQHDAAGFDTEAASILRSHGISNGTVDGSFARATIRRAANSIRNGIKKPTPVTHLGVGTATVEGVASNRQLLDTEGNLLHVRWSSDTDPATASLPRGVIDPTLRLISFWSGDVPVAALSYYATHPQVVNGDGAVTSTFIGRARNRVESRLNVPMIHFTGAAGNVTVGKYNDGSAEIASKLTNRVADGMERAWQATDRRPISTTDVKWQVCQLSLPLSKNLDSEAIASTLSSTAGRRSIRTAIAEAIPMVSTISRYGLYPILFRLPLDTTIERRQNYLHTAEMARSIAWIQRRESGVTIPLSCLRLGDVGIINAPGEPFVEYQIAASELRPDLTIAFAGYGDKGPCYIGTKDAYYRGGYGVHGPRSKVSPDVEKELFSGIKELLDIPASRDVTTPSDITRERKPRLSAEVPLDARLRARKYATSSR